MKRIAILSFFALGLLLSHGAAANAQDCAKVCAMAPAAKKSKCIDGCKAKAAKGEIKDKSGKSKAGQAANARQTLSDSAKLRSCQACVGQANVESCCKSKPGCKFVNMGGGAKSCDTAGGSGDDASFISRAKALLEQKLEVLKSAADKAYSSAKASILQKIVDALNEKVRAGAGIADPDFRADYAAGKVSKEQAVERMTNIMWTGVLLPLAKSVGGAAIKAAVFAAVVASAVATVQTGGIAALAAHAIRKVAEAAVGFVFTKISEWLVGKILTSVQGAFLPTVRKHVSQNIDSLLKAASSAVPKSK